MDLTLWKDKLDAYLDPQEGDMLRLLERIVNMDSFTTDAQDVDQLGTVLTDWLREAGFQTFMMPKTEAPADEPWQADLGHVFMAKTHGREAEPGIVFLGHMDTVFPKGTAQARPFKIEGDRATGRGRHEGGACGQPVRGAGPEAARPDRLPHDPHVLAR